MPIDQSDRIAISLKVVGIATQIKGVEQAQSIIQGQTVSAQALDTANKNLFDPVNSLVNAYQLEYNDLTGQLHTTIAEQDLIDAANKKLQNDFFPNNPSVSVPSIASADNVWTKFPPYALNFALGKNYSESYTAVTKEQDLINAILALITSAGTYTDIQNTTGEQCVATGTCSLSQYTDQATCVANSGVWTPGPDSIIPYPAVQTLKSNMVTAVNSLLSFLTTEASVIVTNDPNSGNQANNNAAISNINSVIIPALNLWLSYPDFNTATGQSTCAGFNSFDPSVLAPTKLYSGDLAALTTALNNRLSYITTRLGQLNTVLGSITQDVTTGNITASSGLYGLRYSYIDLRLNTIGGSLTDLEQLNASNSAQTSIISNLTTTQNIYDTILDATSFSADPTGTAIVHLVDASFLSVGDTVYVVSNSQAELLRAVKSINGNAVTLNDIVPQKYSIADMGRLYKTLV